MFNPIDILMMNCFGYAFEQCYSSDICIGKRDDSDEAQLLELKAIAELYSEHMNCMVDRNITEADVTDAVTNYIPLHMLVRVKEATMLRELYLCQYEDCEARGSKECLECYHYDLCYLDPEDR